MSEAFIRSLVSGAMRHPTLATSVPADVLIDALTTSARMQFRGEAVQVYIPSVGSRQERVHRAREILEMWNGRNIPELAQRYGLTERRVRQIVQRQQSRKSSP